MLRETKDSEGINSLKQESMITEQHLDLGKAPFEFSFGT